MNCSYKLTETEVVSAMQLHGRGSNKTLLMLSIAAIALVLLGALTDFGAIGFAGAISGLFGYFAVLYLIIPFNAKRQYKQHAALRSEMTLSVSQQGISFKNKSGESTLQWDEIDKWKRGKGVILLYISSNMFHMVPSRALSNEDEFSILLTEKIGPDKT